MAIRARVMLSGLRAETSGEVATWACLAPRVRRYDLFILTDERGRMWRVTGGWRASRLAYRAMDRANGLARDRGRVRDAESRQVKRALVALGVGASLAAGIQYAVLAKLGQPTWTAMWAWPLAVLALSGVLILSVSIERWWITIERRVQRRCRARANR